MDGPPRQSVPTRPAGSTMRALSRRPPKLRLDGRIFGARQVSTEHSAGTFFDIRVAECPDSDAHNQLSEKNIHFRSKRGKASSTVALPPARRPAGASPRGRAVYFFWLLDSRGDRAPARPCCARTDGELADGLSRNGGRRSEGRNHRKLPFVTTRRGSASGSRSGAWSRGSASGPTCTGSPCATAWPASYGTSREGSGSRSRGKGGR